MGAPHTGERAGIAAILSDRRVPGVVLVVFIVMAGAGLVLPVLPLFARSFGVGYGAVGLLVSAYGLARLVFDLVAGPVDDRLGVRLTAVLGLALLAGWTLPVVGFAWAFTLAAVPTAMALALVVRTPETLRRAV